MAKVSVWDKEGKEHSMEPVDARECEQVLGWSTTPPESVSTSPTSPTSPQSAPVVDMTVAQLKDALTAAGVTFKASANKAELLSLLDTLPKAK